MLRDDATDRAGLEWINGEGKTWLAVRGASRGAAPYYNPLDDRVQAAMNDVVRELVERYGRHPAFGGVALQLGPSSYAQLPGQYWGYDDRTIDQFTKETGVQVPGEGSGAAPGSTGERSGLPICIAPWAPRWPRPVLMPGSIWPASI
jgi:hypothetical protein